MPPKGKKRVTTESVSVKARRVTTKAKPESGRSAGKAPRVARGHSSAQPVEAVKPPRPRRVAKAVEAAPPGSPLL